ncbi:angiomotin [Drosophila mojavensis]|uniref:PHD-type domain-containing protein n=1 Tax=Drosophila mojavensis TaxID=7230 RepID=B4L4H9_DROMO|nr:angiomotin [Drosophila mojavensis]EDW07457.2 uncharacterized protein Dmoj_GI14860 [Drosophila mojavensis]
MSANSNDNLCEDISLLKSYIEYFDVLPLELRNDIIYCQRALRDFLKVHGLVSDVFKEQADADPVQMRRILDELESEVYEINAEQQWLMMRLEKQLESLYKKLAANNIRILPDLGNEYISSLIVPFVGDTNYKIYPKSVLCRDTEEMLIRKHFLISHDDDGGIEPLKLSELDDNVPLLLVNALTATPTAKPTATITAPDIVQASTSSGAQMMIEKNDLGDNIMRASSSLSPAPAKLQPELLPVLTKKDDPRSLLIPRNAQTSDVQPEKFAESASSLTPPPPPPPPPPPLVAAKQRASRADAKQANKTTSPPPLAPITKPPIGTDFEVVAQSRMNLRQALRRARKTKQQPRQIDEEDVVVLPVDKVTTESTPPPSVAVSKAKAGKAIEITATPVVLATVHATTNKKSAPSVSSKQYKTRNAHGVGRKPTSNPSAAQVAAQQAAAAAAAAAAATTAATAAATAAAAAAATAGSSGSSDDSHHELELEQQRLCASAAQWRDEPRETRVLPSEYGREHFLGLFGLYTHEMVKKLCQRHSKRKRRTVQNASGVVFHYGQQLAAFDTVRQKKLKDKPEFLLSPKDKRLQAKKAHKANAAAAAATNRKSKSKTPEKLEDVGSSQPDVGKQKCKECKKRGENLQSCLSCHGVYHMDCHEDAKGKPQSSNRCPQCLRDWNLSGRIKVAASS